MPSPVVPESSGIQNYANITEEREANKKQWVLWQSRMEEDFAKVGRYDKSSTLNAKEKAEAWEVILASYSADNPYTVKDNIFRMKAVERNRHWKEYKKSGKLFVDTVPSNARVRILNIGPKFFQGMELDPGSYHVEVSVEGYKSKKRWVDLAAGEDENISIQLEALVAMHPDENKFTNSLGMKFVYVKPGSFIMGSPSGESDRDDDEKQHRVTLTRGFYLQTKELTVGQWRKFARASGYKSDAETGGGAYVWNGDKWEKKAGIYWDNPGLSQTDANPVTCVSWNDAQAFAKWLSREESGDYRLPTEAEWEYAARAGTKTPFYMGNCLSTDQADYNGSYFGNGCSKGTFRQKVTPVGIFSPNPWGLYDMHGNVWEWCQDWYGDYPSGSVIDPVGPSSGYYRVRRGGSWVCSAGACRSANRGWYALGYQYYDLGFRLVRDVSTTSPLISSTSNVIKRDSIYVVYANGIVKDTNTGVDWKAGPDRDTDWNEARSWVQSLNLDGGGWRMPTMRELKGLYKKGMGPHNITPLLKATSEKDLWVWTGETYGPLKARTFYFGDGYPGWGLRLLSYFGRAFAVRSRGDG